MNQLSGLDTIIIIAYIVAVTALGSSFFRRGETMEGYFLADRRMGYIAIGISLFASLVSAISYLGLAGFAYEHGFPYTFIPLNAVIYVPIVMLVILPFWHKLKLYTAYEYLERRFSPLLRTLCSLMFLVLRASYLGLAIYAPSLVLSLVTGMSLHAAILIIGPVTTVYTSLGGMKAVIWTDVLQFFVFLGALLTVVWMAIGKLGGVGSFVEVAHSHGRLNFVDWNLDPTVVTGFLALFLGDLMVNMSQYGVDQTVLQRYLTAKSIKESKQGLVLQAMIWLPFTFLLALAGVAVYLFYQLNPSRLGAISSPDAALPYFVLHELPSGIAGLLVGGVLAAAMSTVSAFLNSLSTASMVDFYGRLIRVGASEAHYMKVSRVVTAGWGLGVTVLALFADRLGTLFRAGMTLNGFFGGVLLGVFLLGMISRRATPQGALIGGGLGLALVLSVAKFTDTAPVWYTIISTGSTLIGGYAASLFFAPQKPESIKEYVVGGTSAPGRG